MSVLLASMPSRRRTSLRAARSRGDGRILYVAITHAKNHALARVADRTWGRRARAAGAPVVWYSTAPDAVLRPRVVLAADGADSSYENLTLRMLRVWEDVMTEFPGFDWYVRVWDDNYVVHENVAAMAALFNASEPVEIGRVHINAVEPLGPFVDGGGGSLLSGEAAARFNATRCEAFARSFPGADGCRFSCEDAWISKCREREGVRAISRRGFMHGSPAELGYTDRQAWCHCPFRETTGDGVLPHESGPAALQPLVMHYMTAGTMASLDRVWYSHAVAAGGERDPGWFCGWVCQDAP